MSGGYDDVGGSRGYIHTDTLLQIRARLKLFSIYCCWVVSGYDLGDSSNIQFGDKYDSIRKTFAMDT